MRDTVDVFVEVYLVGRAACRKTVYSLLMQGARASSRARPGDDCVQAALTRMSRALEDRAVGSSGADEAAAELVREAVRLTHDRPGRPLFVVGGGLLTPLTTHFATTGFHPSFMFLEWSAYQRPSAGGGGLADGGGTRGDEEFRVLLGSLRYDRQAAAFPTRPGLWAEHARVLGLPDAGGWLAPDAALPARTLVLLNNNLGYWNEAGFDQLEAGLLLRRSEPWIRNSRGAVEAALSCSGDARVVVRFHPHTRREHADFRELDAWLRAHPRVTVCDARVPLPELAADVTAAVVSYGSSGVRMAQLGVPLFSFRDDVERSPHARAAIRDPALLRPEALRAHLASAAAPDRTALLEGVAAHTYTADELRRGEVFDDVHALLFTTQTTN